MTDEDRNTILLIKGVISELTPEQQKACKQVADRLRQIVLEAGDVGGLAFALVGAELQAMAED